MATNFKDCPVCIEPLDNIHGPNTIEHHDNAVLKACNSKVPHLIHRQCLVSLCSLPDNMGKYPCPICRQELNRDNVDMRDPVTNDDLKGGKRKKIHRRRTHKNKKRKSRRRQRTYRKK